MINIINNIEKKYNEVINYCTECNKEVKVNNINVCIKGCNVEVTKVMVDNGDIIVYYIDENNDMNDIEFSKINFYDQLNILRILIKSINHPNEESMNSEMNSEWI